MGTKKGISIKEAKEILKAYDFGFIGYAGSLKDAIDTVLPIVEKYQKIEDIYYHQSGQALENSLRAVVENGNNQI